MNPALTYFISTLTPEGDRPDISPQFKYLTTAELDYCKKNIAVRIVEFNFRRDKITKSLEKPRNTTFRI